MLGCAAMRAVPWPLIAPPPCAARRYHTTLAVQPGCAEAHNNLGALAGACACAGAGAGAGWRSSACP